MEFHRANSRRSRFSKNSKSESRGYRSNDRKSRTGDRRQKPQMHDATCGDCGASCQIPFEPRHNKPVLCNDCFKKAKPRGERSSPKNFPRRDKQDKPRDTFRKNKYFEGGSETFYSNLRGKLFEILGGKQCSNCGFSDERALGFSDVDDKELFDSIRRGGSASSWGKYISNPELARKKLRVLCLNCNQTK